MNRQFAGMGQELVIETSEVKQLARDVGLPDKVAAVLFNRFTSSENQKLALYGAPGAGVQMRQK